MEPCIDVVPAGKICSPFGVFHEHHGANRGDNAALNAFENAVGRVRIASPIVGVDGHNTTAALTRCGSGAIGLNSRGLNDPRPIPIWVVHALFFTHD